MAIPKEMEKVVSAVLDRHCCDLVQGTYRRERTGWVLRLLIERRDTVSSCGSGVDHRLCASVSRDIGTTLEVEELVDREYTLEVSSPGIERPLVRAEDFERFAGKPVKIKVRECLAGRKCFTGTLRGSRNGEILIDTNSERTIAIPGDLVEKANLVYEPKSLTARRRDM